VTVYAKARDIVATSRLRLRRIVVRDRATTGQGGIQNSRDATSLPEGENIKATRIGVGLPTKVKWAVD